MELLYRSKDVYKRQERIQNFVTACQNGDSKLKAIKMLDYLDAVSYTHLDVYKRQAIGRVKIFLWNVAA